jgi:hypothetical protein
MSTGVDFGAERNVPRPTQRRMPDRRARATSLLPIEGTTKCSRIALGSGMASVAGVKPMGASDSKLVPPLPVSHF